jgi:hypothetical protein
MADFGNGSQAGQAEQNGQPEKDYGIQTNPDSVHGRL